MFTQNLVNEGLFPPTYYIVYSYHYISTTGNIKQRGRGGTREEKHSSNYEWQWA